MRTRLETPSAGFTMIEMIAVTLVLLIIAAAIAPRLIADQQSASLKELEARIARLPAQAKSEALRTQNPVSIRISGNTLVMNEEEINQTQDATSGDGSTTLSNTTATSYSGSNQTELSSDPIQLRQIDLGSDIQVDSVQLNGQNSDIGSWIWTVYPDGSAQQGGIEFSSGSAKMSLELESNGESQWVSGALPDASQDQWPAGQLATSSSSTQ
jgi:prepilin-type N-terminal cleavage/methylation domain-containing protein